MLTSWQFTGSPWFKLKHNGVDPCRLLALPRCTRSDTRLPSPGPHRHLHVITYVTYHAGVALVVTALMLFRSVTSNVNDCPATTSLARSAQLWTTQRLTLMPPVAAAMLTLINWMPLSNTFSSLVQHLINPSATLTDDAAHAETARPRPPRWRTRPPGSSCAMPTMRCSR